MYTKVDTKHSTNAKELRFSTRHHAVMVNRSSTPSPVFIVHSSLLAAQLSVLQKIHQRAQGQSKRNTQALSPFLAGTTPRTLPPAVSQRREQQRRIPFLPRPAPDLASQSQKPGYEDTALLQPRAHDRSGARDHDTLRDGRSPCLTLGLDSPPVLRPVAQPSSSAVSRSVVRYIGNCL
jgi:hypothetical protein